MKKYYILLLVLMLSLLIFLRCEKKIAEPEETLVTLAAPILVNPVNRATITTIIPTLKWLAVEDAVTYEVLVDTSNEFSNPKISYSDLRGTTFITDTLGLGLYYWKVRAKNGEWSKVWHFTIELKETIVEDTENDYSFSFLGNPFKSRYTDGSGFEIARHVWDMQLWDDKIYFGHGSELLNSGPTDIWYYDPIQQEFFTEFAVDEEAIFEYYKYGNSMYIPGQDATESWDYGNFYVNHGEGWNKYRTIPNQAHVSEIHIFHDTLFVTCSGGDSGGGTLSSADDGKTWDLYTINDRSKFSGNLFTFQNILYCGYTSPIYKYNGKQFQLENVAFLPNWAEGQIEELTLNYNNKLVFLMKKQEFHSRTVCYASTTESYHEISLFSSKIPSDMLISSDTLFLLTSTRISSNNYLTEIFTTTNLSEWSKIFETSTPAYASSFEYYLDSFYISLGMDFLFNTNGEQSEFQFCGDIYKITKK